jgi:RNA exonuclease 1
MILHLTADAPPPSWLKVENPSHISKVVAILIPGLTLPLLDIPVPSKSSNPNMPSGVPPNVPKLPFLSRFMHACPTRAPGDRNRMHSVMSAFVSVPVSGEEKKRRMEERIRRACYFHFHSGIFIGRTLMNNSTEEQTTKGDPSMYTLSLDQMIDDEYPIPSYMLPMNSEARALPEGWIETLNVPPRRTLGERKKPPKVYALDCEMVSQLQSFSSFLSAVFLFHGLTFV